ncbi:biotin carboxylase [Polaromonas sp. CF318]|uniref:ATP-binding protein n=1 Tax=Polaromonas sp. CF318 TaxID=1144318 RepID=UPI0002712DA7|nr:biotin carboxylase [Polaromonas sp. CF318]
MTSITSLLVANRGEIARRVIRTAHAMGINTVAVYSDADADALHVREAGMACALGGDSPADSYLRIDKLIAAAQASGADAVHPGYGFLSENAAFAEAVIAAGLAWVGPPPAAIRQLGSKSAAKQLAQAQGVPCLPGYQGADQSDARFEAEAGRIGYPVMVKAVAGGGGRGMRLVEAAGYLRAALHSARSEAASAFGSEELLIEKALLNPRHVEVQVFADTHGHCIHLGERDCSVQRRHQKLIEETPSPAVDAALRARMCGAAVALAKAAGYVGAGTVEFLVEGDDLSAAGPPQGARAPEGLEPAAPNLLEQVWTGDRGEASRELRPARPRAAHEVASVGVNFFLMEMNTRLQVEHPVTEAVTGLDLVEWQLRVARGEALPLAQDEVVLTGHAIEVRLCAEDEDFRPHAGLVQHFREPGGVRFDHALFEGLVVPPHYDSMLGKLIAHAATRSEAVDMLIAALGRTEVLGLPTNRGFLARCLGHPVFGAGEALIPFLAEQGAGLREALQKEEAKTTVPLGLAALFHGVASDLPCPFPKPLRLRHRGELLDLRVREQGRGQFEVEADGRTRQAALTTAPGEAATVRIGETRWRVAAVRLQGAVGQSASRWHVQAGGVDLFMEDASFEAVSSGGAAASQELRAPFNGKVITVHALPGQAVRRGDTLLVIESMKLEHAINAPHDAVLAAVMVESGQQAASGQVLLRFEA